MGSCCTKSQVDEDPPVHKYPAHPRPHQVDEGLRAKQARAKQQLRGVLPVTSSQKHHHEYPPSHHHPNGVSPGHYRHRDQHPTPSPPPPLPPQHQQQQQQSHRRPKAVAETNNSVEHLKLPELIPKRPQPSQPGERTKKLTARVGSSIKDNKETIPLGKRTNFGYQRDFKHKYTLGKLLGHGQFGYTYVAIEKATGERMAVKTIEKKQMTLPISVDDVKREVKILRTLSGHENIVQFYASFEDDDLVYIVMELCEGGELLDRILAKKDSRYSEKDAARIVRQMLNVAARCHLNGVVHRDMKPENFLFKSPKEDSPLKATDFGLSDYIKPGKRFQDVVGSAYYVAPEVLRRKSGPESDVWSIGVITYILLCGRRPFWDKTEQGIFTEVLKKKPDFREKPWPTISLSAKDFVKKLLVKDAAVRLTAAQALSHPWAKEGGDASDIPLDISVLSNMREFVKYSRLKQLALRALASTLDSSDIADLRDQFNAIDMDRNGTITLEEMRDALQKDRPWCIQESRIVEILQAMDSNRDGIVDFDEFVAATLHVHQLEETDSEKWQKRSKAAFSKFDFDGDGYITADELKIVTGLKGSMDTLLDEADTDGDGRISLPEFQKLLRQASLGSRNNNDHVPPRPVVNARRRQESLTTAS